MLLEGGFIRGGLIIGCVFLFTRVRACNWATSFPGRFSPGKTALGTRLPGDGPATGQPRSQGPLLPVPVKQNVWVSPGPETGVLRRRTSLHAVFDSWSVEKWLTFPARICLLEAFTCKKFGKLVSFVLSVIHKGYLSENVYLWFPYKDQNCNAKVKFLDPA